jgi:hypothetical protein
MWWIIDPAEGAVAGEVVRLWHRGVIGKQDLAIVLVFGRDLK